MKKNDNSPFVRKEKAIPGTHIDNVVFHISQARVLGIVDTATNYTPLV